jgi:MerR HTH family regulatory protein
MQLSDEILSSAETAKALGTSLRTLRRWAEAEPPKGPKRNIVAGRAIYRKADVLAYRAEREAKWRTAASLDTSNHQVGA